VADTRKLDQPSAAAGDSADAALFESWEREYEGDPEFVLHGLLVDLAEEIGRIMHDRGVSQSDLAERMGVSRQQVSRLLGTPSNTTLRTLVRIACALGADVSVGLSVPPADA